MYKPPQTAALGESRKRIAVIGSGISGLGAAWLLAPHHDVTIYEAQDRPGGHSRTRMAKGVAVDTGFIVCNPRTYLLFLPLMEHLGIELVPTDMSFSASFGGGAYEFGTRTLPALFAQPSKLFDLSHLRMLRDTLRFFRGAMTYADRDLSLGELIDKMGMGVEFRDRFLLPISGAIWSTPTWDMLDFPAAPFLRFFDQHGLLSVADHPQWFTVKGGSQTYVEALLAATQCDLRLADPVKAVVRDPVGVTIHSTLDTARFDEVVLACHAPQALKLVDTPTAEEHAILSQFHTQPNRVVLHSDRRFLPKRKAAWSSWNYVTQNAALPTDRPVSLSYWMNLLQDLKTDAPLIVTLNPEHEPNEIYDETWLHHPEFNAASVAAQAHLPLIQGANRLWFAGAWTRYGFHEDGLLSALRVAQGMGIGWPLGPDPWAGEAAGTSARSIA
ncbi:amine oxidase [Thioclava sp. SK-1]|uniref:NAD(P)/FAD-dependent oxidoreductase n=1 Tax=Thioclava sp. SK-1 TaxID=1889770 RepID=UPI000826FCE5|nr:FAD-dependent oxidoreductase [Thioclava sp. SK-1]OCX66478.1 amine oxidase [Thioclava sp. SK-1]